MFRVAHAGERHHGHSQPDRQFCKHTRARHAPPSLSTDKRATTQCPWHGRCHAAICLCNAMVDHDRRSQYNGGKQHTTTGIGRPAVAHRQPQHLPPPWSPALLCSVQWCSCSLSWQRDSTRAIPHPLHITFSDMCSSADGACACVTMLAARTSSLMSSPLHAPPQSASLPAALPLVAMPAFK
jgi:hypothetical protein